jgi:uncharacterized protein YlzI (FlbEa/FlbD family)
MKRDGFTVINDNVKETQYKTPGETLMINGKALVVKFESSEKVVINGKTELCVFENVKGITINANASRCVFIKCGSVLIKGKADTCVFLDVAETNIKISSGTSGNCTLNGNPFIQVPKAFTQVMGSSSSNIRIGNIKVSGGGVLSLFGDATVYRKNGAVERTPNVNDINIDGDFSMRGSEMTITGKGTLYGVPVTAGTYRKFQNQLYRKDGHQWLKYEDGEWVISDFEPLGMCVGCDSAPAKLGCSSCKQKLYCRTNCADEKWTEHHVCVKK